MTFSQFFRFVYGLILGTSTPYLKPVRRPAWPTAVREERERLLVFWGGFQNTVLLLSADRTKGLLIDSNSGEVTDKIRDWCQENNVTIEMIVQTNWRPSVGYGALAWDAPTYGGHYKEEFWREFWPNQKPDYSCVTQPRQLQWQGWELDLIPIGPACTQGDLAVHIRSEKILLAGALAYNHIHPILCPAHGLDVSNWLNQLKGLSELMTDKDSCWIPGEGELGTAQSWQEFINYLEVLAHSATEFSECRKRYDWKEIPGYTSLEENFDILRNKSTAYTTLQ